MSIFSEMQTEFKNMTTYGQIIRIKHYTGSVSSTEFDDAHVLSLSGTAVWTSGLILPVTNKNGSYEALLLEQGKILQSDKRLYVAGDVETTATMKIGIGSPVLFEYSVLPDGIVAYPPVGDIVYKKIFLRTLSNGSLIGE